MRFVFLDKTGVMSLPDCPLRMFSMLECNLVGLEK